MTSRTPPIGRSGQALIGFVTAAAAVAAVGIGAAAAGSAEPIDHANPSPRDGKPVRYALSGSAPVAEFISYQTAVEQVRAPNVSLPWSVDFTAFTKQPLVISAQSQGSVTCTIEVDGQVVHQATAHGAPARTVCSYHGGFED